jgi:fatty-acid desaturase
MGVWAAGVFCAFLSFWNRKTGVGGMGGVLHFVHVLLWSSQKRVGCVGGLGHVFGKRNTKTGVGGMGRMV